ncbi:MAG: hypothetical protein H6598_00930 [Flavobacteriales bacterium]|nr:hypothetical protein [Flavobacteriales bacterium]
MRIILLSILSLLFIQCSEQSKHEVETPPEETNTPKTFEGLCLDLLNSSANKTEMNKSFIESTFGITVQSFANIDTIFIDDQYLTITTNFDDSQLKFIKISSYTDSLSYTEHVDALEETIQNWLKNNNVKIYSTPNSISFASEHYKISFKKFPNQGVDLTVNLQNELSTTSCVGDIYLIQEHINSLLNSIISNNSINLNFGDAEGFITSLQKNELQINYSCTVSTKLKLLDQQSLIQLINSITKKQFKLEDDRYIWQINNIKIYYSVLSDGHLIKWDETAD